MTRSIVRATAALLLGAVAVVLSACVYEPVAPGYGYSDPGYTYYNSDAYGAPPAFGGGVGVIFQGGGRHGERGWR